MKLNCTEPKYMKCKIKLIEIHIELHIQMLEMGLSPMREKNLLCHVQKKNVVVSYLPHTNVVYVIYILVLIV